ncbi:MAG TPA: hypothetical protein DD640_02635 [Clostridiales bacterium]|nr:hypothetical protein [Clostridiales bacterium]
MNELFAVKPVDKQFYLEHIKDFLPDQFIDSHTHIWLEQFRIQSEHTLIRSVSWPSLVARDNSVEDLLQTYRLLFPDKQVLPLLMGQPTNDIDLEANNRYVADSAKRYALPALLITVPEWTGDEVREKILAGGFRGTKVYLNFAPAYIPQNEIRIFDFLPPHQLQVLNAMKAVVVLHIPRSQRLKDPVNLAQMAEIAQKFPDIKLIIAHVGRAYCDEDIGNAFEVLNQAPNLLFDISANTNQHTFEKLIEAVGPRRILFGSDMPILRMRSRRICEQGNYINLVPPGVYDPASLDSHMRVVDALTAQSLTFFMYEEILAFKKAAQATGLNRQDVADVFYHNARRVLGL